MASEVQEVFQPHFEVSKDKDTVNIIVHFPGFIRKEELRVQLMGKPIPHTLRISGEGKSGSDNKKRWSFKEDFSIAADRNTNAITAKLENGILQVTLPGKTPGAQEKAQEQTNIPRVAPPEPKPSQPDQKPTDGEGKERREKVSSEAVRGGGSSSSYPPPQPQEPNKKGEEHENGKPANAQVNEKDVSEGVPKPQEPNSQIQQAKSKSVTGDDSCLEMNLGRHGKALNLGLVVLAAIGIGLCVKKIYDY